MLKLSLDELSNFRDWFCKLPSRGLLILIKLLQLEPSVLLDLKQQFDSSIVTKVSLPIQRNNNNANITQIKKAKLGMEPTSMQDDFNQPLLDTWNEGFKLETGFNNSNLMYGSFSSPLDTPSSPSSDFMVHTTTTSTTKPVTHPSSVHIDPSKFPMGVSMELL